MPYMLGGRQHFAPASLALLCATLSVAGAAQSVAPFIATDVGCGWEMCCVLSIDGFVKCWGPNSESGSDELGFVDLGGKVEKAWFGGLFNSFVVQLTDGRVVGWGKSWSRDAKSVSEILSFGVGRSVVQLSVGLDWTCFILDNNEVKCAGIFESRWQVDSFNPRTRSLDEMPAIDFGGRVPVEIAATKQNCCVRFTDGSVSCFGTNNNGEGGAGHGDPIPPLVGEIPPINLGAGRTCELLAAGFQHFCCVLDGGGVVCWGEGWKGRLGNGGGGSRGHEPYTMGENLTEIIFPSAVTKLSLGAWHGCAMYGTDIECWGEGIGGPLLHGGTHDNLSPPVGPIALPSGRTPVVMAAGNEITAVLFDDGSVRFGGNPYYFRIVGGQKSIGDGAVSIDMGLEGFRPTMKNLKKKCVLVPAPVALMLKAKRCL